MRAIAFTVALGVALVAALVIGHRIADAGCRGSGGGGSSGGGGGGGGDGHTWRSEPGCEDQSDVVGFRQCRKFAAWSSNLRYPRFLLEGGATLRRFGTLLDSRTGSVSHGTESFSYRVVQPPERDALDVALVSTLRASFGLPHGLYAGAEADLGGVVQPAPAAIEMMSTGTFGSPDLRQKRGLVVDALGVLGVRGAAGSGSLGVELAGGVRTVSYGFHSRYHDCEQSVSMTAVAPVAEARARGELWLSPWLTAGVTIGTSVLERGNWMGGVYLGIHSRAFGGER